MALNAIELAARTCAAVRKFEAAVNVEYPAGSSVRFRYRNREGVVCVGTGIVSKHQYMTADMAESGLRLVLSDEMLAETGRAFERPNGSLDPPGGTVTVNWGAIV